MRKVSLLVLLVLAFVAFTALSVSAEEAAAAHKYVGAKKCKGCHKAQFESWSATTHATAFGRLSEAEQKDAKCTVCHITGVDKKEVTLEGVQCEACHGAGSDYKSAKIMSKKKWKADPEGQKKLALAAGLIMPTEETCKKCHIKEGNANFKEFDFAKRKDLVHPKVDKK